MSFQDYRFLDAILAISVILFCVGIFGFLTRNRLVGLGLMFFGGALATSGFGEFHGSRAALLLSAVAIFLAFLRLSMVVEPPRLAEPVRGDGLQTSESPDEDAEPIASADADANDTSSDCRAETIVPEQEGTLT